MILMSTVTIAIIGAVVIAVTVMLIGVTAVRRRRRLQRRFGPEYDRLVGEGDSKLKADSELAGRERRVHGLDIKPLNAPARARFAQQWAGIQEQFVDAPADAVASSQVLVVAVMSELGYPAANPDQVLADLSVEHAGALDRYRAAEMTSQSAAAGTASTEDLRLAMIGYRALFLDLLGESDTGNGSAAGGPVPVSEAGDPDSDERDVQVAETQPNIAAVTPVTDGPDQQHSLTTEVELTR
jgi:hypothetical protein